MNTWLEPEISYGVAWAGMIPFLIIDTGLALPRAVYVKPGQAAACMFFTYLINPAFCLKAKELFPRLFTSPTPYDKINASLSKATSWGWCT